MNIKNINKLDSSQMAYIINQCLEAVEKSNLGGIYFKDSEGNIIKTPEGVPICIQAHLSTFLTILQNYFPKNFDSETIIKEV